MSKFILAILCLVVTSNIAVSESRADDIVLDDTICGNCADPVLDQHRYTLNALGWCFQDFEPLAQGANFGFTLTHGPSSPCAEWASYFAWRQTDAKIAFELCGPIGHHGQNIDCVAATVRYEVQCGPEVEIFGYSYCQPTGVDYVVAQTVAPNGNVDTVRLPVLRNGSFHGPLPRSDSDFLPYPPGSVGDGLPPNPGPNDVHQPHGDQNYAHYGFECTVVPTIMH